MASSPSLRANAWLAGVSVKNSELLRVGLHLLEALPIAGLTAAVTALESVKTGRKAVEKAAKDGKFGKGHLAAVRPARPRKCRRALAGWRGLTRASATDGHL